MTIHQTADHAPAVPAWENVASPALLVFPDLVQANIARMLTMAGGPRRLRPHLKTTKMPAVLRLLLDAGIDQFKCATLAEMQMALETGARDLLLACQPVGPNITGLSTLAKEHPGARLSTVVDDLTIAEQLDAQCQSDKVSLDVYIDIDCGMHRTGIAPGSEALALQQSLHNLAALDFQGWHVYDGHLRQTDVAERRAALEACFQPVWDMVQAAGANHSTVIAGGTPTFPMHAKDPRVICSPGTCVFWDAGYASILPDMTFDCAALLLTRVISKTKDQLTLDLGHKAVASENPIDRRVVLPDLPDAQFLSQSEEHLVVQSPDAGDWHLGDALLGIPWHICPSVALYDRATTIVDNRVSGTWEIPARRRFP